IDDPALSWPYAALANMTADSSQAYLLLGQALLLRPDDFTLLEAAANAAFEAGLYAEAEELSHQFKRLGRPAEAHFLFGRIEEAKGHLPLALEQYRIATTFDPNFARYRVGVARLLDRIGIRSEALAEYDTLW